MIQVNAMGDGCPIPVVKTKKALEALTGAEVIETLVDNEIAVENLRKFAENRGLAVETKTLGPKQFSVLITVREDQVGKPADVEGESFEDCSLPQKRKKVVVIASDKMGEGDPELGTSLMKAFIYALGQQDTLPSTILLYNQGAKVSCEGSASLQDLKELASLGVEILTCGTCLNFYEIADQLAVGEATNMYVIVEKMIQADLILKP